MLIALRDSGCELSPGLGHRTKQLWKKAILYHGESQNWVLACLRISRAVFSDIVTLQILCSVKEFINLSVKNRL